MICNEETPNSVVFQGRLVSTKGRNVSELMQDLTQWVATAPRVVVQGVQLVADPKCSIKLSELGDSKCVMIQDKEQAESSQADEPLASSNWNNRPFCTTCTDCTGSMWHHNDAKESDVSVHNLAGM